MAKENDMVLGGGMMRVFCVFAVMCGALPWSIALCATSQIYLDEPTHVGSGCPDGHASAALNEEGSELSLSFDSYVVTAGGDTSTLSARKTCDFAVLLRVPPGVSVGISKVDYHGFNDLPLGSYSRFTTEYFFSGGRGPHFEQTFTGPLKATYLLTKSVDDSETVWSRCGESVVLRSTSNMLVSSPSAHAAQARVGAIDALPGLVYHLQCKPCS
jgi:hypothetical protein